MEAGAKIPKTFRLERRLVTVLEEVAKGSDRTQTEVVSQTLTRALMPGGNGPGQMDDVELLIRTLAHYVDSKVITKQAVFALFDWTPEESSKAGKDLVEDSTMAPVQAAPQGPTPAPQDEINLALWLSERTEHPRSLCQMFIVQGRVRIDGAIVEDPLIVRSSLGEVSLDGELVSTP